ncbi:MAG TPA: hypothetical protein VNZ45_09185, partial [Bacteroidia bacterium]|nr:hypothetical protein [Bacteroidia bacterium]
MKKLLFTLPEMKRALLCFIFSFSFFTVFSQDWVRMMQDPKANVKDVQAAFYKWYAQHKSKNTEEKNAVNKSRGETEEDGYALFKRWEYKMMLNTYPSGNRPDPISVANEYKEYLSSHRAEHRASAACNWTYVGNPNVPQYGGDGRIDRLIFYPGNTNIIYACSPSGGLWKTNNGGTTWATNTDQFENLGIGDMAINPLKPSIMYLGTG